MASVAPAARKPAVRPARPAALPATFQTKLEVGGANDHYEREADSVARRVVGGGSAASVPPTITPLGAQCKSMPKAEGKKKEEEKPTPKPSPKVQKKSAPPATKKEEEKPKSAPKPVQKKAQRRAQRDGDGGAGPGGGMAPASVESSVGRMQSAGAPGLETGTRSFMESRMGQDFGGVRVHKDSAAHSAAQALNARAFTVGNDIFFNRGEYQPHSRAGRELIAHELTHTVQQSGGAARKVQRNGTGGGTDDDDVSPSTTPATGGAATLFPIPGIPGATVDTSSTGGAPGTITVPRLPLPFVAGTLKGAAGGEATPRFAPGRALPVEGQPLNFAPPMPARDADSVPAQVWTSNIQADGGFASGMSSRLQEIISSTPNHFAFQEGSNLVYYLQTKAGSQHQIFVGTIAELVASDALIRPQWKADGTGLFSNTERFDADHFLEMQLGGADHLSNMWLLKASYNRSVGSRIGNAVHNSIKAIVDRAKTMDDIPAASRPQSVQQAKASWNITFAEVVRDANDSGAPPYYWTRPQIARGDHLAGLKVLSEPDLIAAGVRPDPNVTPTRVRVFPSPEGGFMKSLRLRPDGTVIIPSDRKLFEGVLIDSATYNGSAPVDAEDTDLLSLQVTVLKTQQNEGQEVIERRQGPVAVKRAPRLGIAGYLSKSSILAVARTTRFKKLSPLTFSDVGISSDGALTGIGTVGSTKLLLPGLNVPLMLHGSDIRMDFPIPSDRLNLGPFSILQASLGLGVGEHGFFLEGYAGFEIRGLGTGSITATAAERGVTIAGTFDLATDFFNPASIGVTYDFDTDTLTATANLGIESGRIPGVESANVNVTITRENVDVDGTISLGGPLAGSTIDVGYTQEEGLTIGGTFPLPMANVPAVQNATITVGAARNPEGVWSFTGTGTATLAVPGATGTLTIAYDDGVVTLTGVGAVERGPASGTLNFTATNGAIDEEGNPIEGEVGNAITAWGRGSVSIQFGSILTGTAGIEYTQDNRVIISGEIALPPTYEVFARREYTRDLLHIEPPEFPIWGVSVAGVGVGIFAFVDARISFNAYVGPGEIRDASISATMDLDHPEDATIHGEGQFFVPAYAGLNLNVGGGLRARIAVAYAQGRVGLEGQLGIEADASASVDLDWNRTDGLSIEADFEANARPKFRLLANASVTVGVDLWVTDVSHTFGPWERTLGEFGPDMELGVDFPVRWSEADGLDLSLDNMTIRQPSLDASALMSSVFDQLA